MNDKQRIKSDPAKNKKIDAAPNSTLKGKMRSELEKTGQFQEPDAKYGINGVSTTAFISSALLTAIGFGIRDGLFQKYTLDSILTGVLMFFLNFLLALLLIVAGVVIFQSIKDSKDSGRNLKIYWILLSLSVIALIILL